MEYLDFSTLVDNEVHTLAGVDEGYVEGTTNYYGRQEQRSALTFLLDGVVYRGVEDEDDGYRSRLGEFARLEGHEVRNTFPPQPVYLRHRTRQEGYGFREDDVLELRDATTSSLVLEVGTADIDDYYPSFVCGFFPQAMTVNEGTVG